MPADPVVTTHMVTERTFVYPARALVPDYVRASIGILFAAAAVLVPMHGFLTGFGAGLAALLLGFGVRTWLLQASPIVLTGDGIHRAGPRPRTIGWAELDHFRLRFFATRRDRKRGWMELTLGGSGTTLTIDSRIAGFEIILARAAAAGGALSLDRATETNLRACGINLADAPLCP